MTDELLRIADIWERSMPVGQTHWEGCEGGHAVCMVVKLAARVRELEVALSESRKWHEGAREVARLLTERAERAEAERDAVAVANCPRLCAEFCNEYQTQRALERAEAERDALQHDIERHVAIASELATENGELRALLREVRAELFAAQDARHRLGHEQDALRALKESP